MSDKLERDKSGALVVNDASGAEAFMQRYNSRLEEVNRINNLEQKVNEMSTSINLILDILRKNSNDNS